MPESKWRQTILIYLPNTITFTSLLLGLVSIMLSGQGSFYWAASCILFCVVLDSLDGYLARKLNTTSPFGMQLDSLTDIVNFGVAPIFLAWQHLLSRGGSVYWVLPFFLVQISAGAYRLARFNLQPSKETSNSDTLGLTITQAGMILTVTVLSDLSMKTGSLPVLTFGLISAFLSFVMSSKLVLTWHSPKKITTIIYLVVAGGLLFFSSIFSIVLVLYLSRLVVSISKHLLGRRREIPNAIT